MADRKFYDVADGLRRGFTQEEISKHIRENGLVADTSGVPAWRREQRDALLNQTRVGMAPNAASVDATTPTDPLFGQPNPANAGGHWSDPIPAVAGFGGGLLGEGLLSIPLAGAMQSVGKGVNIALRRRAGLPSEHGAREIAASMAKEGALGSAAQGLGLATGATVGRVGEGLMTSAMKDPVAARTAIAGDVRGTVGPPYKAWRSAQQIASENMNRLGPEIEAVLKDAQALGKTADPRRFEAVLLKRVHKAGMNRTADPDAYDFWVGRLNDWRRDFGGHPTRHMTPQRMTPINPVQLQEMKRANAENALRLYESRARVGAGTKESLDEKYAKDLADWSRSELRTMIPGGKGTRGIDELNAEWERMSRLEESARVAHTPPRGSTSPVTSVGHLRQYGGGHSFQLPQLPPDLASRLALMTTARPTVFGVKALPWAVDLGLSTGLARNRQQ